MCNINLQFSFDLYIKPTHSGICLTFDSFVPLFRKCTLITAEFHSIKCNTSAEYFHKALGMIKNKFLSNGYPEDFINFLLIIR